MSNPSGITIADECISAFNQLRTGPESTRPKFIIYKISDDNKSIVVEETSTAKDYEVFRQKLSASVDKDGNSAPRYAIYDMEYHPGSEGKRVQQFKRTLDLNVSVYADGLEELEWEAVLQEVSGGHA
ncbi:unnamed protein product [Penicillium nalgiovense]|uniref:Cofilin n=1 Tax=Penicillium nalgiovense TaxID=60175 RepID=A0A9W4IHY1_PENNA|nr:unnamed protein product [Penicillium nalgiovense]CAG8055011.1 unnamed protein product [Penicillium nalgiovense]CAG8072890.1 unnamed protein product [Penicillium nalgiovense]CAG8086321.1 unnamed protein product [Penicillium nalgiovense]CAG8095450.1 unnamed protein product [Penicillium nalgiovense]